MAGQTEIKAVIHIRGGKKGPSFQAVYPRPDGKGEEEQFIRQDAILFDKASAADGDEAILVMEGRKIISCTIPGKGAGLPAPVSGAELYSGWNWKQVPLPSLPADVSRNALENAAAPYNFIPYDPAAVIPEAAGGRGTWSGVLHCRLEALTPLLVSGIREKLDNGMSACRFFQVNGKYAIPGSSIKGVLRSMVEILSYSAMKQVSDKELFWRVVTDQAYREKFGDDALSGNESIKGGYLRLHGAEYKLYPTVVRRIKNGEQAPDGCEVVKTGKISSYNKKLQRTVTSCDYAFFPSSQSGLPVPREVVADFLRQLTDNQKNRWDKEKCSTGAGHPVFYRTDAGDNVAEIGLCRYFRLKYEKSPASLAGSAVALDFAENLFGRVDREHTVKGRVSVEPCFVEGRPHSEKGCPAVLTTPHPTSLAHYLQQDRYRVRRQRDGRKNNPGTLTGYGKEARLRGWKMYWHHDADESVWFPELAEQGKKPSESLVSWLYPLAAGASTEVKIHVDRLTDLELGAVLEALSLASGDNAFKLGMGKPLGFGSVKLELVKAEVEDVRARYASLRTRLKGGRSALGEETQKKLREAFRLNRLESLHALGKWKEVKDYGQLPAVKALRLMADFTHRPAPAKVRYMSLNEFKNKALLAGSEDVPKQK